MFNSARIAAVAALALASLGAQAESTLAAVKSKGHLQCGVNTGLPGFAVADAKGKWTGMEVEV